MCDFIGFYPPFSLCYEEKKTGDILYSGYSAGCRGIAQFLEQLVGLLCGSLLRHIVQGRTTPHFVCVLLPGKTERK